MSALVQSDELDDIAELQWRIGVPLSTLILAFIAVPLSKSPPRAGRYGRIAVGLLAIHHLFERAERGESMDRGRRDVAGAGLVVGAWGRLLFALGLLAAQNQVHRRIFS